MNEAHVDTGLCPGDLAEWVSTSKDYEVEDDEQLWSTTMQQYAHIGRSSVHLVVGVLGDVIVWVNSRGLFSAEVDDWANRQALHHFPVKARPLSILARPRRSENERGK